MYILLFFFHKIVAKYTPKRTKLHHLKTFSPGNKPRKRVAWPRSAWHKALCK